MYKNNDNISHAKSFNLNYFLPELKIFPRIRCSPQNRGILQSWFTIQMFVNYFWEVHWVIILCPLWPTGCCPSLPETGKDRRDRTGVLSVTGRRDRGGYRCPNIALLLREIRRNRYPLCCRPKRLWMIQVPKYCLLHTLKATINGRYLCQTCGFVRTWYLS